MKTNQSNIAFIVGAVLAVVAASVPARAQQVEYYHLDALGSVRAVTDENGGILTRHDYYPYGEEWNEPPSNDTRRFTGKERDTETELDYFGARYYGAGIAIFTSVDPAVTVDANVVDPQRWNRYGYARGNSMRYVDPTGNVIRLASMGPAQRTTVLSDLNAFTGNTYDAPAGDLTLVSRGAGSSEIATQFLDYMIGLSAVINVRDARDPALGFNDFRLKGLDFAETLNQLGADVLLDFVDFRNLDYNGVDPATYNTGSNLVHELLHQVGFQDPITEALAATTTGDTVNFVNLIRAERGLPARGPAYAARKRFNFFGLFGTGGLSLQFQGQDLHFSRR